MVVCFPCPILAHLCSHADVSSGSTPGLSAMSHRKLQEFCMLLIFPLIFPLSIRLVKCVSFPKVVATNAFTPGEDNLDQIPNHLSCVFDLEGF